MAKKVKKTSCKLLTRASRLTLITLAQAYTAAHTTSLESTAIAIENAMPVFSTFAELTAYNTYGASS